MNDQPKPTDESNAQVRKARKRRVQSFPVLPYSQALQLASELFRNGAGQPVRRLTLFDAIGKSPESGHSRTLVTTSVKYGLILGGTQSETLELTELGRKAVDDSFPTRERALASVKCAIGSVTPFEGLYSRFKGNKLPSKPVLIDAVQEFEVEKEHAEQAVDIFLENLQDVGLLRTLSGVERIISEDHLVDSLQPDSVAQRDSGQTAASEQRYPPPITSGQASFETTAFYVTPIGSEGSAERRHSDLFLGTLIEPAVESFGLKVVRADAIDKPGIITRQVIQYLMEARLVIVDLSFHNPNVFYELAIRHMARKPCVQIIQKSNTIPFDISQLRTIVIDNTDIYSWTPKIELWRSEIANQIRQAFDDPQSSESPVDWYMNRVS